MRTAVPKFTDESSEAKRDNLLLSVRVCAITCDCYPDDPLVRRTAEAAARAGCEYHVICSMKDGNEEYEVFNGVHIHRIFMKRKRGKTTGQNHGKPIWQNHPVMVYLCVPGFCEGCTITSQA